MGKHRGVDRRNFFAELKRRNVYKVAVAYAVVGWLLIQVATQVFPFFEIPNWSVRLVILLLMLGFPVALILAWAFELTPEGIKRADEVTPAEAGQRRGQKLTALVLIAAAIAAALLIWQFARERRVNPETTQTSRAEGVQTHPAGVPAIPAKSVAVLPFENLSSDKENAFFAQGIQDEIITALSKISGLKVISRTSTASYNSKPENLPEIARELRVANVLEGSVQKVADKVHINVQLLQADTDAHLWAQSYDRQLTDIFSVEAEVAKTVADSLRATLSPQEKAQVENKPTNNADAYVLYLRAREYQSRPDNLLGDFQSAARLYEQAIDLDPNFALAHARLAAVMCSIYHWFEPTEAVAQKAHNEANKSLMLQPNLGEAHLALGLYLYYIVADYQRALFELDLAARALPNDGEVGLFVAAVQRRQGNLMTCLATYKHAETLDPRNGELLYDAAQTYFGLRDWQTAAERMDRVLALAPDSLNVKIQRGYIEFFRTGSTRAITTALDGTPPNVDPDGIVTFARWDVAMMNRDTTAAENALAACRLEAVTSQTGVPLPKSYLQGCVDTLRGNTPKARVAFEAALPKLEKIVANSPQNAIRRAQLGFLYALMGQKGDALREGRRAVQLKPVSKDVIEGAQVEAFLALISARTVEPDEAVSQIARLLTKPFAVDYADESITLADLRTRWEWDPLRNNPRFQQLVAGPEPKTSYQ